MTDRPVSPLLKISRHLPLIEKILFVSFLAGVVLALMEINNDLLRYALLGLGVTFFFYAYHPTDISGEEERQRGFIELLGMTIIPKILWISCAIIATGLFLALGDDRNSGYKQMLTIGVLAVGSASLILMFVAIKGGNDIGRVTPVLLRALPLLMAGLYVLLGYAKVR